MEDHLKDTYQSGVAMALGGFQLLEESLKTYLELHFDAVRHLVQNKVHFGYERSDYQEAALGRLVQVFGKLCANKQLVSDLRAAVRKRDHYAHQALLKLYFGQPISVDEYPALLDETEKSIDEVQSLGKRLVAEINKVRAARDGT